MSILLRGVTAVGGGTLFLFLLFAGAQTSLAAETDADHESDARQTGSSGSGDAIGGQVVAATSSGDTSIDATNMSRDARVESGEAEGSNDLHRVTWTTGFGDEDPFIEPLDEDDEDVEDDWHFSTFAITGDAIGGQILGVVTAASGSTDAVIANTSDEVDIASGDAGAFDDAFAETGDAIGGQAGGISSAGTTTLDSTNLSNEVGVESGEAFAFDDGVALTGDGVGGQLFGVVTGPSGTADVVLANTSDDVDVLTGDATGIDDGFAETGVGIAGQVAAVNAGGITSVDATNASLDGEVRTGDAEAIGDAVSLTGDGVAGQVLGVVSAPGGRVDLVTHNTSFLFDLVTGEAFMRSDEFRFIGWPDVSDP